MRRLLVALLLLGSAGSAWAQDEQPADQPTEQPADQPTEQPADQPTEQPADQPTEQPADQPADPPDTQPDRIPPPDVTPRPIDAEADDDDLRGGAPDWVDSATHDQVEGGQRWRFDTPNGVVNVWTPPQYDAATAGTVVYVHGHGDTSDSAFTNHHLARQFLESGVNAIFIVPEAPPDGEEEVSWESLGALQRAMATATGVPRPPGELVVMGHSGAFRSIVPWLDDAHIGHIILLDAMYANEEEFRNWIERSPGHDRKKLTIVSYTTRSRSEGFVSRLEAGRAVKVFRVPPNYQGLSKKQRAAQVLYLRSQYPHMDIVTDGKVIPLVLRRTALTRF